MSPLRKPLDGIRVLSFEIQVAGPYCTMMLAVGLPIGPVQNAQEIFECPHVAARQLLIDVPDPILGSARLVGPVAKLSASPEPLTYPAPLLGQHNAEIMTELLGYTEEQRFLLIPWAEI